MRSALIALFEKPVPAGQETERKVLTRVLCNTALPFDRPIFDFQEVLHLSAMARLRPDLVQPVLWEASPESKSILTNLRSLEQEHVAAFLGNSVALIGLVRCLI